MLEWSNEQPIEFYTPGTLVTLLPIPFPFPLDHLPLFESIMYASACFAVLGILTRCSLLCYALGYLYLSGTASAWGWHDHRPSMIAQILLLLPLLPGLRDMSVDALVLNRRRKQHTSWRLFSEQRWGAHLILLIVVCFYCTSGISKIRYGGIHWMNGETLSFYLSGKTLSSQLQQYSTTDAVADSLTWKDGVGLTHYLYGARPSTVARFVSEHLWLAMLSSIVAVLFEIAAPLVYLNRSIRSWYFLLGFSFHLSVYFMMGIDFFTWSIVDFCFIEWGVLLAPVRELLRQTPRELAT